MAGTDDGLRRAAAAVHHWPGLRTSYAVIPPHEDETITGPFQIGVAFSAHEDVTYRTEGRLDRATYAGGSVICSAHDTIVWSGVREATEAVELYPDPQLIAETVDGVASERHWWPVQRSVVGRTDPVVVGIASMFRRAHATGAYLSEVQASALAHRLAHHLVTEYGGRTGRTERRHAGLRRTELETIHELIEAHLAEPLTLDELSRAVHLSSFHFARAFRSTVGLPPHAYVTSRRIDRARALLRTTSTPVDDVAVRVGIRNHSHFRRVFAAHVGVTPGRYRRELG